jgi:hypothetical protein
MDRGNPRDPASTPPPKILHNEPHESGMVRVTYSLPGLRRVTVSIPDHRWVQGVAPALARPLAEFVGELDRQDAAIAATLPDA